MRAVLKRNRQFGSYSRSALVGVGLALIAADDAGAQTAGDILEKTSPEHQVGYINGVVEGLAYARFLRDHPDETGMRCIYDWYLKGDGRNQKRIIAWLERHSEQRVGVLMHVLIRQECGD